MKKILFSVLILAASILMSFNFTDHASAKVKKVSGYITWYNGVGKRGADGKRLGHWDCATKMGFDVPRKGTKIRAYSKAKPKKVITVYKYDVGRMPRGAVLDVSPRAFRALGFSTSKGKIKGHYYYKK
ncbi:septal ring lytic transglycosylase RlpA family protein [Bacillus changyiensis]|uniref:septal ring lytic transglycosylase RlpA family protein n=1 Tax=Bacillus changyiensis TaxID=3004103 RepID=UPI0022E1F0D2|nr:septal ring lytic transglycosylase RlpA family protein [Bacillus changyiensis]MDA1477082.1 septal ring lytic transglycosylase RlpA family protein [Bacillus changyiensis]